MRAFAVSVGSRYGTTTARCRAPVPLPFRDSIIHARARLDHGAVELARRVGSPALRRHVAARLDADREARLDDQRARDDAEAAATAGELRRLAARC